MQTNVARKVNKQLADSQWAKIFFKKSRPNKLHTSNQINQFHENFFGQISFFAITKMANNQFLNWEKVQTAKNAISRIFF